MLNIIFPEKENFYPIKSKSAFVEGILLGLGVNLNT
ncbi:hypothetical protein EAb13_CDS0114 [Acinetobacter phage EAb13]|nr:hypothetical protein EAb13_CDS0114 [Acinetobacter phage EAb13]